MTVIVIVKHKRRTKRLYESKLGEGKIIFSDIDGTFLGPNSVIIEKNYDAVQTFVQAGGLFTFSSGRLSLNRVVPGFERLVNAPQILNNGALIQNTDGEILLEAFLDSAAAKDIILLLCGAFPSDKFGYECHMNQAGDQYYKVCFLQSLRSSLKCTV